MKHLIILLLSAIVMFSASEAMAQKSKKKKNKKKEEVEVVEEVEVEETEIDIEVDYDSHLSSSNRVLSQEYYSFKQKYNTQNINDEYDWFYDKNSSYGNRKYGIVNTNGEIILPNVFKYTYGGDSYNKILYIENKYGLFSLAEKRWAIPIENDNIESLNSNFFATKKNGKFTIVDFNDKPVTDKTWYSIKTISSLENYVKVSEKRNGSTYYGVFSLLEKKLVIPCKYLDLYRTYNNTNIFKVKDANSSKYNLININNELLFKNWYNSIGVPSDISNRFIVNKNNTYGVVDSSEKVIIPLTYMSISISAYSDGSHLSKNSEGKYGFMTIEGKVTLPFEYDKLDKKYGSNNIISSKNSKCGIVRINSGLPQEIISCDYDDITNLEKVLIIKKDGKFGLLNGNGKMVVNPIYDNLEIFGNKIVIAKIKGKYEILNDQGQKITTERFKDAGIIVDESNYYSNSAFTFLKVKKKDKFLIMDKVGKIIGTNAFDDIVSEFKNVFVVKKNNKYGLFTLFDNSLLVDYSYDLITKTKKYYVGIKGNKVDLLKYQRGKITLINSEN